MATKTRHPACKCSSGGSSNSSEASRVPGRRLSQCCRSQCMDVRWPPYRLQRRLLRERRDVYTGDALFSRASPANTDLAGGPVAPRRAERRFFLPTGQTSPALAKAHILAKETLHGDANCAGAHTQSSLSSFDHALRLNYAALLRGFGFPVVTKRRTKRFLQTFLSPRVPVYVFRLVRQTSFLPL